MILSAEETDENGQDSDCPRCAKLRAEITRLKVQLDEMEQRAYHDVLTGLPNRRYFMEALENRIMRCQRYGDVSALLFLDINDLKKLNDNHGHAAGDLMICRLGEILKENVRMSDMVARIGGDEFALLIDNLDADELESKIAYLLERIRSSKLPHEGKLLQFSAAIGYCFIGPQDNVAMLMSRADEAMYAEKSK